MRVKKFIPTVLVGAVATLAFGVAPALAAAPEAPVTKSPAVGVTATTATFEGTLNPNVEAKAGWYFAYSPEQDGPACIDAFTAGGEGESAEEFKAKLVTSEATGLEPHRKYKFCLVADNEAGETTPSGNEVAFETLAAKPEVSGESVTGLDTSEPQLQARINPENEETSYQFEYSTSEEKLLNDEGTVIAGAPPAAKLPAAFEEIAVGPFGLTGLQAGPVYYYRAVATNATGTFDGAVEHFQTLAGPHVATNPAGEATRTTVPVSATVTPQGLASTYHFEFIPLAAYEAARAGGAANPFEGAGGRATYDTKLANENQESFTDYTAHPVALTLEELQPETTYVYTLVAHNELGSQVGVPQVFTTAVRTPPTASTGGAVNVSQTSATVTGAADTRGLQSTLQFEFGTTPYAGALLPATGGAVEGSLVALSDTFNGELQPGTTYYYRAVASNQDGTSYGALQSFTTPGFPAAFPSATLAPTVPYTPIAQLNAKEAKEGKAVNPPKKKTKGKKKAKKHGKRGKKKKK